MTGFSTHIYLFLIPGIIANIAHMIIVKKDLLKTLRIPLSLALFGENKTYRGFVFLPLAMGTICIAESLIAGPFTETYLTDFLIGSGLGLIYMLSELPNSFIKRKLGIATGSSTENYKLLQLIIDKTDSLIGACLFYFLVTDIAFSSLILLFFISLALHLSISWSLVLLKLKKSL